MNWERFNEASKSVLAGAQQKMSELGHKEMVSEHLIYGIFTSGDDDIDSVIEAATLDTKKLTDELSQRLIARGTTTDKKDSEQIYISPRLAGIFDNAVREADTAFKGFVTPVDILLAVVVDEKNAKNPILSRYGLDEKRLRTILKYQSESKSGEKDKHGKFIKEYGIDLTALAREGKLDPVIGREEEVLRVMEILSRRTKNNPVLVGEPGVGKTAIAEGLAQRIVAGHVPETLRGKSVITLDLSAMIAGAKYRGEFEQRLKGFVDDVRASEGRIVLFIDEIHTIVGAGATDGAMDASNIMKPALARGELQCMGATTLREYRLYIEKDSALERRFQPVMVDEPSSEEALNIIKGLQPKYEEHHQVKYTPEAIDATVELSVRYVNDRFLPDKAIDLLDEAGAKVHLSDSYLPSELAELETRIKNMQAEREEIAGKQDYEKAAYLQMEIKKLEDEFEAKRKEWMEERRDVSANKSEVNRDVIAQVVSKWTGIPVSTLTVKESDRLLKLEEHLGKRVVGQKHALGIISDAIRRAKAGLKDPRKPIGSFILLGPTGVGKTELAKALAEFLFLDEQALVRLDMSEYMEKHSVSRLVGAPPGYVGYDEGGQLTEAVKRKPYSIILLDEIEKAHPDVFNILLQLLDDGRLTDSKGRLVDFKNTIILMTSNAGADKLINGEKGIEQMYAREFLAAQKLFRPEFLNRIDDVILFEKLSRKNLTQIVDLLLSEVRERLDKKGITLSISESVKDLIVSIGYSSEYGARPLKRAIQDHIVSPLAKEIIAGKFVDGDTVKVSEKNEQVVFGKG